MLTLTQLLLVCSSILLLIDPSLQCDQFPEIMQHCTRISCEYLEDNGLEREYSTFECDIGYEFRAGVTVETFLTEGGLIDEEIQCNPIGCKFRDMPTNENIDPESNTFIKFSLCVPAILEGHCLPDISYVDFECKPGFRIDLELGDLRVRCLASYLWDSRPTCDIPDVPTTRRITTPSQTTIMPTTIRSITTEQTTNTASLPSGITLETTYPPPYNICFDVYPKPAYHDPANITYNLITHEIIKNVWLPGSTITFSCLYGYYPNRSIRELTITCQTSGEWTKVPDCEIHPCWSTLPSRPLNGRREVGLVMTNSFYTNASHVNFSCNPFYDLVGRNRLYCYGSEWEKDVPVCRQSPILCFNKPETTDGLAYLKHISWSNFTHELDYTRNETRIVFTSADYICRPGYQFQDATKTVFKEFKGESWPCQTVFCIGLNKWPNIPKCVPSK